MDGEPVNEGAEGATHRVPPPAAQAGAPALTAAAFTNHLAGQSSPYLRSHVHNPVDWHPWGREALERARRERKPILLSVGYAACHWCHVMAHESFEDRATAAAMNELFVNIKVDREERPDLDRLYQLAQQMLTGRSGGWPLTMFLMHDDQRPFFGGTYFPREARFGLPAFREVLRQVATYYHAHLDELRVNAARVVQALDELAASPGGRTLQPQAMLSAEPLHQCRAQLERSFDADYGGFGAAPKFPHAPDLARLLRTWHASAQADAPDLRALYMTSLTLTRMAEGGLFDQLGGGFFRYSVDERWEIPHFEKMLYDNAQLLGVYAETAAATGETLFRRTAERTAEFLLRELMSPAGAFYCSLDADSEGHEGRYYAWEGSQVRAALSERAWPLFAARYGLDEAANFEGRWHLTARIAPESLAERAQLPLDTVRTELGAAAEQLLALRAQRVRPERDEKILTAWNALTIGALAVGARWLQRPAWAEAATRALTYLRSEHWHDGRLLASAGAGAALPGYLDDHAFLLDAILELSAVRFSASELRWAIELAELLLAHFEDRERGGFYFTADDHETLISRPKSFHDESLPAGNALAARALLRLGYLLGEPRYLAAAEHTLRAAWPGLQAHPEGHASLLLALEEFLDPAPIIVLRGSAPALRGWQHSVDGVFAPRRWTLAIDAGEQGLPAALAAKAVRDGPVGYICRGAQCSAAIDSLPLLLEALELPNAAATGGPLR